MLLQLQPTPGQGFIPLNIGEHLIDQRLGELGWCRHPLQPRTPADGSCGLWGIAAHVSDSQQPGAEDRGVRVTKQFVNSLRKKLVGWLPTALELEIIEWGGWHRWDGQPETPQQWMDRTANPGEWADEMMLAVVSQYYGRDVVLVTIFPVYVSVCMDIQ